MARARLEDASARAGVRLEVASLDSFSEKLRTFHPDLLILDLDTGREKALARLDELRGRAFLPERIVGFMSHVDVALAEAARAAGCEAIARGKFWRRLPELLSGG